MNATETTMKYLGVILALALVAGQVLAFRINENDSQLQHVRHKRSLNDKFYNFLESFKDVLREGNATLGLPPMDPYVNEELDLVINETIAQGTVQLRNVNAVGLAGYNIDDAEVALFPPSVTVGLTWPQLFLETDYTFKVLFANKYDAFGNGHLVLTVSNLMFHTIVKFNLSGGFRVKSMETKISLGGLKLHVTGLFEDPQISDMLGVALSDVAPEMVQIYQANITAIVNEKATALIDSKFEGKSFEDIIHMFD
ncbi:uncharacterized protein [Venturia canescens]|uniref:uncharacterized protein n=1 Tax=Venturia canescens TaxID=32260 RepID=UPI001C9D271B|nr:uncharacterized protein LOC122416194 [Venturia canescens]